MDIVESYPLRGRNLRSTGILGSHLSLLFFLSFLLSSFLSSFLSKIMGMLFMFPVFKSINCKVMSSILFLWFSKTRSSALGLGWVGRPGGGVEDEVRVSWCRALSGSQ